MKIPTANNVRARTVKKPKEKEMSMETIVKIYLRLWIVPRLENAEEGQTCVNEEIPTEAYRDMPLFYSICKKILKPLGYKSEESHDGGGMFSTLCVSW